MITHNLLFDFLLFDLGLVFWFRADWLYRYRIAGHLAEDDWSKLAQRSNSWVAERIIVKAARAYMIRREAQSWFEQTDFSEWQKAYSQIEKKYILWNGKLIITEHRLKNLS